MIHNENNHSAGETKATDDAVTATAATATAATATAATATAATATARVCFQQLPRHLRLGIFHCLTYRNYLLVSPTCTMFKTDLAFFSENNLVLRCLHVPEDYRTLNEGYRRIEQSKGAVSTIVLGQGDHVVEFDEDRMNYLRIKCPVTIVGSRDVLDKSNIVVVGGFIINANGVHVEHLTIRGSCRNGVFGFSFPFSSCTLNDLMIDQCGRSGVLAHGSSTLVRCHNITISKCLFNGVCASSGATVILDGSQTLISHNCLMEESDYYGLHVYGSSSKIQIVSPLTKQSISKGNKGGGNWGARGGASLKQIKTLKSKK
jgi:hypothetical protein